MEIYFTDLIYLLIMYYCNIIGSELVRIDSTFCYTVHLPKLI